MFKKVEIVREARNSTLPRRIIVKERYDSGYYKSIDDMNELTERRLKKLVADATKSESR